jgi:hypothetical protein
MFQTNQKNLTFLSFRLNQKNLLFQNYQKNRLILTNPMFLNFLKTQIRLMFQKNLMNQMNHLH